MLLRGSVGCFYKAEKSASSPPASQRVPQLGSAELFVSTPVTAFSIERPPTEARSATSQASQGWKAQLWTELRFFEGGGCGVAFFRTDKPWTIRNTALTNNYRSWLSWNQLSPQCQILHLSVTLWETSVVRYWSLTGNRFPGFVIWPRSIVRAHHRNFLSCATNMKRDERPEFKDLGIPLRSSFWDYLLDYLTATSTGNFKNLVQTKGRLLLLKW